MRNKLCGVFLLLQALFVTAFTQDMCGCRYVFKEQPSNSVMCNPYPTGAFITRCLVGFSTNEGIPLSLVWFSKAHSTASPQPVSSGFSTTNGANSVGSTLNISLTLEMAELYEDFRYFCRVSFSNGTVLKQSQDVYLFPRDVVARVLDYPDCQQGSVQSTHFEECIDPKYNVNTQTTAEPTTLPPTTAAPPPPTTQSVTDSPTTPPPPPVTTPPPTTPPPTTTTPPPTTPPPTTPPPLPPPPPPPPPATIPPPTTPPSTSSPPTVNNTPLTSEEMILLYSAMAAAVLLIIIVVFLLLCLCLWNRLCQQSKYCTCCS